MKAVKSGLSVGYIEFIGWFFFYLIDKQKIESGWVKQNLMSA